MRRPLIFWLRGNRTFNVHSSPDCCRLSFTIGPFAFRWLRR